MIGSQAAVDFRMTDCSLLTCNIVMEREKKKICLSKLMFQVCRYVGTQEVEQAFLFLRTLAGSILEILGGLLPSLPVSFRV